MHVEHVFPCGSDTLSQPLA